MAMEIVISLIILFVGIVVLVSIHVCIVRRAIPTENNNRGRGGQEQNSATPKRMSDSENVDDLKNLPCFDYYEEPEKGGSLVDCAVCLENFKVGDACRLLPNCSHSFHVQCIDSWILKTPICPICRTLVHSRLMVPTVLREESAVSENVEMEIV